ncbi:MAG: MFS transporter [Pseudomonadota bacterium]
MLIPILSAGNFVIGMGAFIAIGLVTPVSDAFGVSTGTAGALMLVYGISYAFAAPLVVGLTGAWPRRRVLTLAMAGFSALAALTALAPTFGALLLARVAMAVWAGMFSPVAATVAAAQAEPGKQGRALALVIVGLTLSQVMGVPAGTWVGYTFGWASAFWIVAGLGALMTLLLALNLPKELPGQTNTAALAKALRTPRLMFMVLFTSSFLGAISVLYGYVAPLLEDQAGFTRDGVSVILLIFGVGAVAGNLLGGLLADRLGPARTLATLSAAQIVLMPFFSFLPDGFTAIAILTFIWSVSGWSFAASQQVRLVRVAGPLAPVALALNAAAIFIGISAGAALGGVIADTLGLGALGIAGGVAAIWTFAHLILSERMTARIQQDLAP